jgi:hypothetical protein
MSNTFVKLPTGDVEIDHIREMCEDLKGTEFQLMEWRPRPALIDKNGKRTRLYTGQKFDANYIDLVEDGWTHDHCQICFVSIGEHENQYTQTEGYFNSYDWVCKSCYETFLTIDNLEEKLGELPQYQR